MSRRKRSFAVTPSISSGVRLITCCNSSSVFNRWLICQRQSFHFSSGTSLHGEFDLVEDRLAKRSAERPFKVFCATPPGSSCSTVILCLPLTPAQLAQRH